MTRRTGVPTMLDEAQQLQNHITRYTPTLQGLFPLNNDLLTAIADCANCLVNLIQELSAVREQGD